MNVIGMALAAALAYPELTAHHVAPVATDSVRVQVALALSQQSGTHEGMDELTASWLDRLGRKKDEPTGAPAATTPTPKAPVADKPQPAQQPRPQSAAPVQQPRPQVIEQRYYQPAYQVVPQGYYYPQQVTPQGYYPPQGSLQSGVNCVSGT